ncbi:hypothetical protein WR25_13043 [Diploscapter pachys]|uniref:Acid ceramidase n=1 Tax=Diploscapter pachys TaxID=2018661 RepID=A0A2A2JUI2_9BILA|nr:hypothetical protein WR25_13043 [Diploscapter pachys]
MPRMFICFAILSSLGLIQAEDPMGIYAAKCLVGEPEVYDPSDMSVPWYNINLDLEPTERWKDVARSHGPQILAALDTVRMMLYLIDVHIYDMLVSLAEKGMPYVPYPYRDEIYGIAEASGVSVGEVALLNMFYEISKGCTSIVAQDPNGKIYHARNQDFGFLFYWNITEKTWQQTIALKELVINVNFLRQGQIVYKATTFAGLAGILTGLKPHAFTISTNSRGGGIASNLYNFFYRGINDMAFVLFADRDVMEKCNNYAEAIDYLSNTPIMAPAYFIVGGRQPGEGAVISRSPNETVHIDVIDTSKPDGFFVLQTNYDWDKPTIYFDDRRTPGNDCMKKLTTYGVSHAGLYQVLSSKPNLNKVTVYTAVMQVDEPTLKAFVRDCPDPCWMV